MTENRSPAAIAAGYACAGPAVDLGALLWEGVAHVDAPIRIPLSAFARHGLVAGDQDTGRTRTVQLMAERLSAHGIPVFLTDIRGDLSGIAAPGTGGETVEQRAAEVGEEWTGLGFPTEFYALGGIGVGVPLRATVTGFGPLLLSRALGLDRVQERSLALVLRHAEARGREPADLGDLRAVLADGLPGAAARAIMASLTACEQQGADPCFGEPAFDTVRELLRTASWESHDASVSHPGGGRGLVSVLELPAVRDKPLLFSTFLVWLLTDLAHRLPEVRGGDGEKPKLVFFIDEAHLLFEGASEAFLESLVRTLRLIRSKGVGVFLVTRSPLEVPADVLEQLGNRMRHALPARAAEDTATLQATARAFLRLTDGPTGDLPAQSPSAESPSAEALSAEELTALLTGLGPGEAVVTVLSEQGPPTPVAAVRLRPPQSLTGPLDARELARVVAGSPLRARYAQAVDQEPSGR